MSKSIALFHATVAAIDPIKTAFKEIWPEAKVWNLLDESLSHEIDAAGGLNGALTARFINLARYGEDRGVDGMLFTCSAFGPAIEECARQFDIPALKPNEAMLEAALKIGGEIGLVATHPPTLPMMQRQLEDAAVAMGVDITVRPVLVEGAWAALDSGNRVEHDGLVLAAAEACADCSAIALAQFSMAPLAAAIQAKVSALVLSSPHTAVMKLKTLLS